MVNAFLRSMRMLTDVLVLSLFFISIFALIGMQLFVGDLRNKCVLIPGTNVTDFQKFVANESKFSLERKKKTKCLSFTNLISFTCGFSGNWLFDDGAPVVCGNSSSARFESL